MKRENFEDLQNDPSDGATGRRAALQSWGVTSFVQELTEENSRQRHDGRFLRFALLISVGTNIVFVLRYLFI